MIEKTVEAGMRECRVIAADEEIRVEFDECFDVYAVDNIGMNDICVSFYPRRNAGDDGVKVIPAGRRGVISCAVNSRNVIYISGRGTADISAGYSSSFIGCPGKDNGTVTGVGNPVMLKGLQGGVPFNKVTISGKNLCIEKCNLTYSGSKITSSPSVQSWIAEVSCGGTYTISMKGAHSRLIIYPTVKYPSIGDNVIKSIAPSSNAEIQAATMVYTFDVPENARYIIAYLSNTTEDDVSEVQVECGQTATDYEQPVTDGVILKVSGADIADVQTETGDAAAAFEPAVGTSYSIMPDANPYTVSADIMQKEGTNFITADGGAVISVNANRKNPQLAKIYEKIGQLELAVITSGGMINV